MTKNRVDNASPITKRVLSMQCVANDENCCLWRKRVVEVSVMPTKVSPMKNLNGAETTKWVLESIGSEVPHTPLPPPSWRASEVMRYRTRSYMYIQPRHPGSHYNYIHSLSLRIHGSSYVKRKTLVCRPRTLKISDKNTCSSTLQKHIIFISIWFD